MSEKLTGRLEASRYFGVDCVDLRNSMTGHRLAPLPLVRNGTWSMHKELVMQCAGEADGIDQMEQELLMKTWD